MRAALIGLLCLLAGCGTTGRSLFKDAPEASYLLITEGEFQGQFTNSELRGCKVTLGGKLNNGNLPFTEFSYSESGCTLKAKPSEAN